jgi:sarcosine oxidase subunit alpha
MSAANRLGVAAGHLLSGTNIDRQRPIHFRLNGRPVSSFAGDSVLSALMGAGYASYGRLDQHPVALAPELPLHVRNGKRSNDQPIPARQLPALDGMDLVTVPAPATRGGWLGRLTGRGRLDLGLDSVDEAVLERLPVASEQACDVCIVGGGIAGLSAALTAARAGRSVVLCERDLAVGGVAILFGRIEGEDLPERVVEGLRAELAKHPSVTVLTGADVVAVGVGYARAVRASDAGGAELVPIRSKATLLAVGASERLPIFSGNRLPGVVSSTSAFLLAHQFGVWPGRSAVLATTVNPAYRLAMLAADAGIAMRRIYDRRPKVESRFVEFCKAYGITISGGTVPTGATRTGTGLALDFAVSFDDYVRPEPQILTDRLIVAGGWQPDLQLWHAAGGRSHWHAQSGTMLPHDGPAGLSLIGSAAGYRSTAAVLASADAAIAGILEQKPRPIIEQEIEPRYETPDGELPIAQTRPSRGAPTYLSSDSSLVSLPMRRRQFWRRSKPIAWTLSDESRRLSFNDIVAGISLGVLPPDAAGAVAAERTSGHMTLEVYPRQPIAAADAARLPETPDYLAGRFGPAPVRWIVSCGEDRRLDPGCLVYVNSDQANPRYAIGVIIAPGSTPGEAIALIGKINAQPGEGATVRDLGRPIPIRLSRREHAAAPTDASV